MRNPMVGGLAVHKQIQRVIFVVIAATICVTAPLVSASNTSQIDDAIASLSINLTEQETRRLEAPYTPRYDFQGLSNDAELQQITARIPQLATPL